MISTDIIYAKLVLVASQLGTGNYSQNEFDQITTLGYSFLNEIKGNDLPGDSVSFGYAAISPSGELIVAIRGTHATDILEWLDDALAVQIPTRLGWLHSGFFAVFNSLRLVQQPEAKEVTVTEYVHSLVSTGQVKSVTICGHSLGGAVATILSLDLKDLLPRVRTFASPRVGSKGFADEFDKVIVDSTRYEHHADIVPALPMFPFWHVGQKVKLRGDVNLSVATNHELSTYIDLLEKSFTTKVGIGSIMNVSTKKEST
jgi:predicted lipase